MTAGPLRLDLPRSRQTQLLRVVLPLRPCIQLCTSAVSGWRPRVLSGTPSRHEDARARDAAAASCDPLASRSSLSFTACLLLLPFTVCLLLAFLVRWYRCQRTDEIQFVRKILKGALVPLRVNGIHELTIRNMQGPTAEERESLVRPGEMKGLQDTVSLFFYVCIGISSLSSFMCGFSLGFSSPTLVAFYKVSVLGMRTLHPSVRDARQEREGGELANVVRRTDTQLGAGTPESRHVPFSHCAAAMLHAVSIDAKRAPFTLYTTTTGVDRGQVAPQMQQHVCLATER